MNLDVETKNKLKEKYCGDLFSTDDIDLNKIDALVPDNELRQIIGLNNSEMAYLNSQKPLDIEAVRKLFIANLNFYRLAMKRNLNIPGSSYLRTLAGVVGYDYNKLCAILSTGKHETIFTSRGRSFGEIIDEEYQARRAK